MKFSSLSCRCKEIILGSILGDGSLKLHKPYRNARFSFRHSLKQEEYFYWKVKEMKEISSGNCVWKQSGRDGWGTEKLRYQSIVHPELTDLYKLTHPHNHFRIRRKWLNKLTPLSLCVWWMDNGSLVSNCRQGVLCTDSFLYDEVLLITNYLKKVWNLKPKIGRVSKNTPEDNKYRIWFRSREDLKNFLRMMLPHIPVKSMLYKFLILYKDPELQERWISEICNLTGFDRIFVEKYTENRKQNLAHFRE